MKHKQTSKQSWNLYTLDTFAPAMHRTVSDITSNIATFWSIPDLSSGNTILDHVYFWKVSTTRGIRRILAPCWLEFGSHSNAGSYWCATDHQTLSLNPSLLVLGTRSHCATNEVTSLQSLYNKKCLEMPAKRQTSSFIRNSEVKLCLTPLCACTRGAKIKRWRKQEEKKRVHTTVCKPWDPPNDTQQQSSYLVWGSGVKSQHCKLLIAIWVRSLCRRLANTASSSMTSINSIWHTRASTLTSLYSGVFRLLMRSG